MRLATYARLESLGNDGHTQIYRARDPEGHDVIVHDPAQRVHTLEDPSEAASYTACLRELAKLDHPNIERITEVGTETLWFAAEYFDYTLSLDRCLRDKSSACSREKRVGVVLDVLAALEYAHERGFVHTAVNPVNVAVLESGPSKLLNFIEWWHTQRALRQGLLSGGTHYLAPEFVGDGTISPAMDLFATGVMLYRVLAGTFPFHGKDGPSTLRAILNEPPRPMAEHCGQCAAQFGAVLDRALAKAPKDRFPTAAGFADALRKVQ
jgi:serine/threonine-protein kinase